MSKIASKTMILNHICAKCSQKLEFDHLDGSNVYLMPCETCAEKRAKAMFAKAIDNAKRQTSK